MDVLITGCDTDLGRTIAENFSQAGHRVIVAGRHRDDLEVLAKELDADALLDALRAVRAITADRPDLSRREWDDAGAAHASAYREALRARRARVRPRGRAVEA